MNAILLKLKYFIQRNIFRDPVLLEVKRWFRDEGDQKLRFDYPLDENSVIWDVGGYHGDFTNLINYMYGSRCFLFEPVPSFFNKCKARFIGNSSIQCFPYGISKNQGQFMISDAGDGSSFVFNKVGKLITAEVRPFELVFDSLGVEEVDLLKINIEGGEFELIPAIIDSGLISRVRFIQVQFHSFAPNAYELREQIRKNLKKTHQEMWCYQFVWESWKRK